MTEIKITQGDDVPVSCRGTIVQVPFKYLEWLDVLKSHVDLGMTTPFKLDCSPDELHELLNYLRDKRPAPLEDLPKDKYLFNYLNVGVTARQLQEKHCAERLVESIVEAFNNDIKMQVTDTFWMRFVSVESDQYWRTRPKRLVELIPSFSLRDGFRYKACLKGTGIEPGDPQTRFGIVLEKLPA